MAVNIVVPKLGQSLGEAIVVRRWLKNEGDLVKAGDPVVELETDKVNLEVSVKHDGMLAHIMRTRGEAVKIGDVLGEVETVGDVNLANLQP